MLGLNAFLPVLLYFYSFSTRRHAFFSQLLDGVGVLRQVRKAHAAKNVRRLAKLNVLVADDLDPVAPGSRKSRNRPGSTLTPAAAKRLRTASLSSTTSPK